MKYEQQEQSFNCEKGQLLSRLAELAPRECPQEGEGGLERTVEQIYYLSERNEQLALEKAGLQEGLARAEQELARAGERERELGLAVQGCRDREAQARQELAELLNMEANVRREFGDLTDRLNRLNREKAGLVAELEAMRRGEDSEYRNKALNRLREENNGLRLELEKAKEKMVELAEDKHKYSLKLDKYRKALKETNSEIKRMEQAEKVYQEMTVFEQGYEQLSLILGLKLKENQPSESKVKDILLSASEKIEKLKLYHLRYKELEEKYFKKLEPREVLGPLKPHSKERLKPARNPRHENEERRASLYKN